MLKYDFYFIKNARFLFLLLVLEKLVTFYLYTIRIHPYRWIRILIK
jgi:hypothetical protein